MPVRGRAAGCGGGRDARPGWNAKGDRLAFVQTDDIMEVEVSGKGVPMLSTPKPLFTRPSLGPGGSARWPAST